VRGIDDLPRETIEDLAVISWRKILEEGGTDLAKEAIEEVGTNLMEAI
jgi:hypothetical protein